MYALVEAIINLLGLRKAYEFYKTDLAGLDWRAAWIAFGIFSMIVALVPILIWLL